MWLHVTGINKGDRRIGRKGIILSYPLHLPLVVEASILEMNLAHSPVVLSIIIIIAEEPLINQS